MYCRKCGKSGKNLKLYDGMCKECWDILHPDEPFPETQEQQVAFEESHPNYKSDKKPISLLVGGIIGAIILCFLMYYTNTELTKSAIGAMLTSRFITPVLAGHVVGVLFSIIGYAQKVQWAAIIACLGWAFAAVSLTAWIPFVVLQLVCSVIGIIATAKKK